MLNTRSLLVLAGLAFATWETVDIFWIDSPAVAAVMACLFLAATIWFWRRQSTPAAVALLILFTVEGLTAPFLQHVMLVTKACDLVLAVTGFVLAASVLLPRRPAESAAALVD